MRFKTFIIFSLIIHALGAVALYFYYNPLKTKPQPSFTNEDTTKNTFANWFKKDKPLIKQQAPDPPEILSPVRDLEPLKKAKKRVLKTKPKKSSKKTPVKADKSPQDPPVTKNSQTSSLKSAQANLKDSASVAKNPEQKTEGLSLPVDKTRPLDLKNPKSTALEQKPKNLEDYKVLGESDLLKKQSPPAKNLEDYEVIEPESSAKSKTPKASPPELKEPSSLTDSLIAQKPEEDKAHFEVIESPEPSQKKPLKS